MSSTIEHPPITENPEPPEQTPERRPLPTPEISLQDDLKLVLERRDEVLASFDPSVKTELQLEIAACQLTDEAREELAKMPDAELGNPLRNPQTMPRLLMYEVMLDKRRANLQVDREKQEIRINHLKDERKALLDYAIPGQTEVIKKAMEDPTVYLEQLMGSLSQKYESRSTKRVDAVTGLTTQRFGLLTEERPPEEVDGMMVLQPRSVDIDVSVGFLPNSDEVSSFKVTSDLEGKLDHLYSLILDTPTTENPEPRFRVVKNGWKKGAPLRVEVASEEEKLVIFQAFVTNFYHGVSGYVEADDELARRLLPVRR